MNLKKMLLILGCVAVFAVIAPSAQVMAAGGPEPPPGATIQGPEIWGELIFYCAPAGAEVVVIRVKRVVDCNVETQAFIDPNWAFGCPPENDPGNPVETAPLDWSLENYKFWDIPGTPYVAKVKNHKKELTAPGGGSLYSWDAQFKFWIPATP